MQSVYIESPLDLKSIILAELKEKDSKTYFKIVGFQNLILKNEIPSERYSLSFLLDLFYTFERGSINISTIIHEVKFLEGKKVESRTKEASKFKRPPLKGLWHKHYFDGNIPALALNVQNALENYGISYFEKRIQAAKVSGKEQFVKVEDIPHIANDVISGNLQRRRKEQKTTGEWLIYAIHENINYYLCLAKHGEDEIVRNKINSSCIFEFPFLNRILP
jgi:hypothetical protein